MPRWTSENDQLLLALILQNHSVSVDGAAVANIWPTQPGEEKPTARAITERVFKIRKNSAGLAASKADAQSVKNPAATATKKTSKKDGTKSTTASPRKRKASTVIPTTESSDVEEVEAPVTPPQKRNKVNVIAKNEPNGQDIRVKNEPGASFPYSPAATTPGNDDVYAYSTESTAEDIYAALEDNVKSHTPINYNGNMSSSLG